MKKNLRLWVALGAMALLVLTACTAAAPYNVPREWSKVQLEGAQAKPGKFVQGKDCVTIILGLQFSAPSILEAEKQALQAAGTKMLIQKTVYAGVENNLGFLADHCWYVEGRGLNL
jgi:hypothetical protein